MRFLPLLLAMASVAPSLPAQEMPPALVATELIEEIEFYEQLTLVGRTEARRESAIVAEVSGRVKSVPAAEGRPVKRGATLATIDCRRVALALDAKKAEAAQAEADAELARKELERALDLVKTQVFPERNLDSAKADERRTAERFRQLEAEEQRLALDLEDCSIRAPYAGFTVRKLVDVGEWVEAGTPVWEMVDLTVVKVMADLPERRFGQVEVGSPVTVTVAGDEDSPLAGKVTGIAPSASETTHTFPVIIEVDNAGGRLGGGMLVRAALSLKGTFSSLAVSKDAVVRQGDETLVYTVADGTASAVTVKTDATQGSLVAIAGEGLAAGQPVVVRGNERIFDGSPVRLGGAVGLGNEDGTREESP